MDLKIKFNLEGSKITDRSRVLITKPGSSIVGILADVVSKALSIPKSKIEPPLNTLSGSAAKFIKGESQKDGKILGVLKLEEIVGKERA
jgi:chemotaxis signal transduction protein